MPTLSAIEDSNGNAVQFISLKGQPQPTMQTVRPIERPGVDGHAYRLEGKRAKPYTMVGSRDADGSSDVTDLFNMLSDMRGEVVTVYDDYKNKFENVMLLDVEKVEEVPLLAGVGGVVDAQTPPTAFFRVRLTLQNFDVP